jgi:uncharacterized coiled-coil DUF342 family protein
MFEQHAEFRDKYNELNMKIDEIAEDLNAVTMEYTLTERYNDIDQEIYELYLWYDEKKKMFEKYMRERMEQEEKIIKITKKINTLNNEVQSARLREFSRVLQQD